MVVRLAANPRAAYPEHNDTGIMGSARDVTGAPVRLLAAGPPALCLDYANTRFWRGRETPTETLAQLEDLIGWCARAGIGFELSARSPDSAAEVLFAEAIVLREVLYRIFSALAAGARSKAGDLRALNKALAATPARSTIAQRGALYAWQVPPQSDAAAPQLLAAVLWSAADLLVGARRGSVRQCANDSCRWLFLDDSRNGSRRWCAMSSCGNRAKARRHYLKHRID
jgi:predicted RNA-binding Zn ribbon-like protein